MKQQQNMAHELQKRCHQEEPCKEHRWRASLFSPDAAVVDAITGLRETVNAKTDMNMKTTKEASRAGRGHVTYGDGSGREASLAQTSARPGREDSSLAGLNEH